MKKTNPYFTSKVFSKEEKNGATVRWTEEKAIALMKKCKSRAEFTSFGGAYSNLQRNKKLSILNKYFGTSGKKWNVRKVIALAKKAKSRTEFC